MPYTAQHSNSIALYADPFNFCSHKKSLYYHRVCPDSYHACTWWGFVTVKAMLSTSTEVLVAKKLALTWNLKCSKWNPHSLALDLFAKERSLRPAAVIQQLAGSKKGKLLQLSTWGTLSAIPEHNQFLMLGCSFKLTFRQPEFLLFSSFFPPSSTLGCHRASSPGGGQSLPEL